jgi:hypothetical protein
MKKVYFTFIFILTLLVVQGQKNVFLEIKPMFQNSVLAMNTNYVAWNGKTFKLDHFDYYLSDVQLTYDGGQTLLIDSVFLVEPQSHTLFLGNYSINQIEKIDFIVGVPKPKNTQTGSEAIDISLYPETHPLSFQTPSMYWGWQAGYMHMIIGGFADDNGDGSLESYFELHNLGNNNQKLIELNNVIQTNSAADQIDIYVNCQVDRWINNISINSVGITHDEIGVNAQILSNAISENVFIQPANADLEENTQNGKIYFTNNYNEMNIQWSNLQDIDHISIFDLNGKKIESVTTNETTGNHIIEGIKSGFYTIQFYNRNSKQIGSLNAVH